MIMLIIETPIFTKLVGENLTDEEYRDLQNYLTVISDAGDVIKGSGGLRKIRWKQKCRGKRGGVRVIYFWKMNSGQILMLYIYPKNVTVDLTTSQLKLLKQIVEKEFL